MPTIYTSGNYYIRIYFGDHNPPHFHLITPNGAALVSIETLEVLKGAVERKTLRAAIAWASENKELLQGKWDEYNLK